MKKVLLLGDSIRMGYDDYVKELLEGKCEVYYDAADNSRFAPYTLWQLIQMYNQYGPFDLVHWNNGYWDMSFDKTTHEPLIPVEEYAHYLRRIARILKNKGAKVVFAFTTPILTSGSAADNTGAFHQRESENAKISIEKSAFSCICSEFTTYRSKVEFRS